MEQVANLIEMMCLPVIGIFIIIGLFLQYHLVLRELTVRFFYKEKHDCICCSVDKEYVDGSIFPVRVPVWLYWDKKRDKVREWIPEYATYFCTTKENDHTVLFIDRWNRKAVASKPSMLVFGVISSSSFFALAYGVSVLVKTILY